MAQIQPAEVAPSGILQDRLLVQASTNDIPDLLRLIDPEFSGLVISGARALDSPPEATAEGMVWMADRRRYAGTSRALGTATFDPRWLNRQREQGAAVVLSDSGYIGAQDQAALHCVLEQTAAAGSDVTAVLPLHIRWLVDDLTCLVEAITAHGVPVAVVLEHSGDPLGVRRNLDGFVELLKLPVPVSLLSSDVSALGALAFGAS